MRPDKRASDQSKERSMTLDGASGDHDQVVIFSCSMNLILAALFSGFFIRAGATVGNDYKLQGKYPQSINTIISYIKAQV